MEVIEQFVEGKFGDPERSEDSIVVTPNFAAVIDGATDKTGAHFDGLPGGRFAAEVLARAIAGLRPTVDPFQAIGELSAALRNAISQANTDGAFAEGPSATLVLFSRARTQIWRVGGGDTYRIGGRSFSRRKPTEMIAARARALYLRELLAEGAVVDVLRSHDPGREFILPLLEREYLFRNAENGHWAFGALDGNDVPPRLVEVVAVPDEMTEIVFASDGYPQVRDTLAETEAYLQHSLSRDPLRIGRFVATKGVGSGQVSFDDRAYLRFAVRRTH